MYNTGFVEEREVCNVIDAVELWRIHLGEGVDGDLADLVAYQKLDREHRGAPCL